MTGRPRAARARGRLAAAVLAALALGAIGAPGVEAQELEPRAYSASPVGANFAGSAYAYSWGTVLFDATVPITDAEGRLNGATLAYGRTFALGGVQALATISLPYVWGTFSGQVAEVDSSATRSGAGDVRAKLAVNLIGSPALAPRDFARTPARRLVAGASLAIIAPTGENDPERLINIGSRRWAFKPEVGVSYNWKRKLYAELYGGVTFFTANDAYYPGQSTREQDPLGSLQAHLSYTFARRSWFALDATRYSGGDARVNGGPPAARLNNTRLGAVAAIGLTDRHSVKLGYSFGAATSVGQNFRTVSAGYQLAWF